MQTQTVSNKPTRVLFKSLTDQGLLDAYIGTKELAYNGAAIRSLRVGLLLRDLDIIVAIARRRGLQLPV